MPLGSIPMVQLSTTLQRVLDPALAAAIPQLLSRDIVHLRRTGFRALVRGLAPAEQKSDALRPTFHPILGSFSFLGRL